jgi:hypothetical protein
MASFVHNPTVSEPDDTDLLDTRVEGGDEEKFPPELIIALKSLVSKTRSRYLVSRRIQVRQAWKSRLYWRGYTRLLDLGNRGLALPNGGGQLAIPQSDEGAVGDTHRWADTENIYLAYGVLLCAVLTGTKPTVRFSPDDFENAEDIAAADNADAVRILVERNNPITDLLQEEARYLFTDGVAYWHTYWCEEEQKEKLEILGALEVSRDIYAKSLDETPYLKYSYERDRNYFKEKYPEVADEIEAGVLGASEDQFDRIARISTNLGMGATAMVGDAMSHLATCQETWFRPDFYHELDDEQREILKEFFPDGVKIVYVGNTFCEALEAKLDDDWSETFAYPGDGAHRPGIGTPLLNVQDKLTDLNDILYEVFDHCLPWRWFDSNAFDFNAIGDQVNLPGMSGLVNTGGRDIRQMMALEEQISVPPELLQQISNLRNEIAQLMTGGYAALFGGSDIGANAPVGTTMIQRDQALGRIGIVYRYIKAGYARAIENILKVAAENRQGEQNLSLPPVMGIGGATTAKIDFDALAKGRFKVYADQDENFPESWAQKKATFQMLMQAAEKNPNGLSAKIIGDPNNQAYGKYILGLPDLKVEGEVSRNKQLTEIDQLLRQEPIPNPAFATIQSGLQTMQAGAASRGEQVPPDVLQALQQQLQSTPQFEPSIPIDADWDDNAVEYQTVNDWINSPDGQKAKQRNPQGFLNVQLHGDAHKQAMQAALAAQPMGQKPPSVSINVKDLPPDEAAQAVEKAGIKAKPEDFAPPTSPMVQ